MKKPQPQNRIDRSETPRPGQDETGSRRWIRQGWRLAARHFSRMAADSQRLCFARPFRLRLNRLAPTLQIPDLFPPIDQELEPFRQYFIGNVLNAGAGDRDISPFVKGQVFNQDISTGLHNANIHIFSPLDKIPKPDGFFDAIVCNAVLEHVADPAAVMREFQRVCKPGGHLYLGVPFMQPEHLDPTDFQRYTLDGLKRLVGQFGFVVVKAEGIHSVYTTLGWVFINWLNAANTFEHFILKWIFFPYIHWKCRHSKLHVHSLASTYRVLARRG